MNDTVRFVFQLGNYVTLRKKCVSSNTRNNNRPEVNIFTRTKCDVENGRYLRDFATMLPSSDKNALASIRTRFVLFMYKKNRKYYDNDYVLAIGRTNISN